MPSLRANPLETSTRKKIDNWLNELGWKTDEDSSECNVITGQAKTLEHNKNLKGKFPDYVLYQSGTDNPLAIIEAKRKGGSIEKALNQGIEYAKALGVDVVFAVDGTFVQTYSILAQSYLSIDGTPVRALLSEQRLKRFLKEGADISETTHEVQHSREELIRVFEWANDLLRQEGLRNLDRFVQFSNILFIKIISEIEEEKEKRGEKRILDKSLCWDAFADIQDPKAMMNYINNSVLKNGLAKEYNHNDDIFQEQLSIQNPQTIQDIVRQLSKLRLINTESEIKGDAFEYFLKNLSLENDLGEYFTPRHLVKFIIRTLDPKFGETIYDPTCGTGGFLIESFSYIKKSCNANDKKILKTLKENSVYGVELTDTYKIAKMNMIITGDGHNNILQGDVLDKSIFSDEANFPDSFDVIVSNPPYSQDTNFGSLYPIPTRKGDCIFVQHIVQRLSNNGRAGVVVPDGFLSEFTQKAFVKTRKYLLENCTIDLIVSLPAGVFYPYAGAKTSILFFTKKSSQKKSISIYEVKNDGFELNASRRPIKGESDIDRITKWLQGDISQPNEVFEIPLDEVIENDYKLNLSDYKKEKIDFLNNFIEPEIIVDDAIDLLENIKKNLSEIKKLLISSKGKSASFKQTKLKDITRISTGGTPSTKEQKYYENGTIPFIRSGELKNNRIKEEDVQQRITEEALKNSNTKLFPQGTVLVALTGTTTGQTALLDISATTNQSVTGIYPSDKFIPEYVWHLLQLNREYLLSKRYGRAQPHIRQGIIEDFEIILPSLEEQKEVVSTFEKLENLNALVSKLGSRNKNLLKNMLIKKFIS